LIVVIKCTFLDNNSIFARMMSSVNFASLKRAELNGE
jgi:hypothetical protein